MNIDESRIENRIHEIGREIFKEVSQAPAASRFSPAYYSNQLLEWVMNTEGLKVPLLRFVDVLPTLSSSESVISHLKEYLGDFARNLPFVLRLGLNLSSTPLASSIAAQLVKKQTTLFAHNFILGETPQASLRSLRRLRRNKTAFTIDLLGESALSEHEARGYLERYLELLKVLGEAVPHWTESSPLVANHLGEKSVLNISVKLSSLYSQCSPQNTDKSIGVLSDRLMELAQAARRLGAYIYVDMEDSSLTEIILKTFKRIFGSEELRDYERCGIVLQTYLRRTEQDLDQLISWTRNRGTPICLRLVKGAYWDTETVSAQLRGWHTPVWIQKSETDASYEQLSRVILSHHQLFFPAFASHNIRSLSHAIAVAEALSIPPTDYELQMLYGMAQPIKQAYTSRGYLVRDYTPIGGVLPGMGYLVRRLLENTANESFLRQGFHEHETPEILLAKPDATTQGKHRYEATLDFSNCPLTDFSVVDNREEIQRSLNVFFEKLNRYPLLVQPIISGRPISGESPVVNNLPEDISLAFSQVEYGSRDLSVSMIERLEKFFPTWKNHPTSSRVAILRKTAEILKTKRSEFVAAIVLEVGKPWAEADADLAEAVDFLHYYAEQAERMFLRKDSGGHGGNSLPGEENLYFYEPRGIAAIISPWNFPIAVPCGMFAAALVCGNCAILKPAEQSSYTARLLFEAFLEAGTPPEAIGFLPGDGEEIGPTLISHPAISTIAFTGSVNVGLGIIFHSAQSSQNAIHVKRVIAEMGGKNAIIIDEDADLDEAVRGVINSAFGYQGQKCSACSRAIVVGDTYQRFLERLVAAARSLEVGRASEPSTFLGPLIDEQAYRRIYRAIDTAKHDCSIVLGPRDEEMDNPPNYCVSPVILANVPSGHPLEQEELFGPVLCVERASSVSAAITMALNTRFALTGGLFSRDPKNIALARDKFSVGNLYINRPCTGALVNRQPFGGFRHSGIGSKAGGPDYLLQFVLPRSISENTMRRGFTPS